LKAGKPEHIPTPETRAVVCSLRRFGVTYEEVAAHIGITKPTLIKHYREELDKTYNESARQVSDFLFNAASGRALQVEDKATHADCVRAAIFWAKTRMGWRETGDIAEKTEAPPLTINFSVKPSQSDIKVTRGT
jgi:predicted transcriptional regulator